MLCALADTVIHLLVFLSLDYILYLVFSSLLLFCSLWPWEQQTDIHLWTLVHVANHVIQGLKHIVSECIHAVKQSMPSCT